MPYYGARVRAARGFAGMTQEELADALGVDAATIKRREAKLGAPNYKEPKKGERLAIAQVCGVPVDFMEEGFAGLGYGPASSEINEWLAGLDEQVRLTRSELAADAAEVLKRIESVQQTIREFRPPPQP